ncbi:MAG: 2Fe-2S iron-sulfur cluster binding domain-containing protein [Deltaproteobacteria bacterium]|nr:2Fe-2S iron-sulfur cluster binding domain-containing protein [Deltaproteobacteria bacterium]
MPYTITLLPFEKQFTCGDNETILEAAMRNGLNLRYGCKFGGCGMCKAQVVEGEVENSEASSFALLDFEKQQGMALLCCAYPESDLSIELWDYDEADLVSGLSVYEFAVDVTRVETLAHDIRGIHLQLYDPQRIVFKAGQYIDVLVPGTNEWRSYSMANPPSRRGEIEIMVKLMPGGVFSSYVDHQLKPGERLTIRGPYGNFYLRNTDHATRNTQQELIFIAGGSGMAPILSLLRDMTESRDSRSVIYFYGARTRRDLFLLDELQSFAQQLPNFCFIPALSEPTQEDAWSGETGLITEVVKRLVPRGGDKQAYMCGPTAMIDAAIVALQKLGIDEKDIFYDKFVTKADTAA